MKWSFAAAGMFILGIFGVVVIILFQKITTINENDYYLLKEITESAMLDSINYELYRDTGRVTIVREKFVENFTRRYAESTLFNGTNYIISFYDIIQEPPKVSLIIDTGIVNYSILEENDAGNSVDVKNALTAILEIPRGSEVEGEYSTGKLRKTYYSMPAIKNGNSISVTEPIRIPGKLQYENITDIKIKPIGNIEIVSPSDPSIDFIGEVMLARLKRESDWGRYSTGEYSSENGDPIFKENYSDNLNVTKPLNTYDCQNPEGAKPTAVVCGGDYDGFWINWEGTTTGNFDDIIVKFVIEWEYKEYKLS